MGIKLRAQPRLKFFNSDGTACQNGYLYTYIPGTTDDKATYQDKDGATPHANPIQLDGNGEAVIWWNGVYDLRLDNEDAVQQWTQANYGEGEDTVNYGNYNKVKDGGFEDDANGDNLPDQWAVTEYPTGGSGAGVAVIDTTDQIEGAQSLKFTSQGDGGGYAESAFFEVTEGEILYMSWMMKSSAADVRNVVEIIWYTSAQVSISTTSLYDNSTTNPTSWTLTTANATPPSTARYAKIRVTGCHSSDATTGSTWFDNVVCIDTVQTVIQLLGYTPVNDAGDTMTGALVMNTAGGTDASIDETGIDKSSGSAETFNIQNSGAGAMTLQVDGNTAWHAGNDGAGSGLDADNLDGQSGAYHLSRANHTGTQTLSTISDAGTLASRNTTQAGDYGANTIDGDDISTNLGIWVLLATVSATNTQWPCSFIDGSGGVVLDATVYRHYRLEWDNLAHQSEGYLAAQVGTSGGFLTTGYNTGSSLMAISGSAAPHGSTYTHVGFMEFTLPTSPAYQPVVMRSTNYCRAAAAGNESATDYNTSTSTIDRIRIGSSSGNMLAQGEVRLYARINQGI